MNMPSSPAERPPILPDSRRRNRRGWLAASGALLLLLALVLAYSTQAWLARRAFDHTAQAALDRQPIVNGHLGALREAERVATPSQDHDIRDAVAYRLQGEAGTGVVTVRFDATDPAHPAIVQGVLRTDDGIAYPLVDPDPDSDASQAGAASDDPLKPRLEYQRNSELANEYPNIFVNIDGTNRSDLELIQYARRKLIAPLAGIGSVSRIYSMENHPAQPIMLLRLDEARMAALKLSVQNVRDALLAAHFRKFSSLAAGETYAWPDADQVPRSTSELLSSLQVGPAGAATVPLAQIASITFSEDTPRQALGLVISDASHTDLGPILAQVRAAVAKQSSPDIRLEVRSSKQPLLRLML